MGVVAEVPPAEDGAVEPTPREMLDRGRLADYLRSGGTLSPADAAARFSVGLRAVIGQTGVDGVRRMSEEAAGVLAGGTTNLAVDVVLPLVEMVISTGAREWPTGVDVGVKARESIRAGGGWRAVLAGLLLGPPHRWGLSVDAAEAPELRPAWSRLVCDAPKVNLDEVDGAALANHTRRILKGVRERAGSEWALELGSRLSTLPLYFEDESAKSAMEDRAVMLREIAARAGYVATWEPKNRTGGKIRVGVLAWDYSARTETYTTYPVFAGLPADGFDVVLFAAAEVEVALPAGSPPVRLLPERPSDAVAFVRQADLDIVVHGTNLTARVHPLALMATNRLARRAVTFFSSPMTTGLTEVDAYVSGELSEGEGSEADYSEKLLRLPGAGYCSGHRRMGSVAHATPGRDRLELPGRAVVFASGAVVHKLSAGVRRAWAEVLAGVPESVLMLFPFAPTWDLQWPRTLLSQVFSAELAEHGVDPSRLKLMQSLPGRDVVVAVLKSADVYLDSFPYTGANSVLDALEAGLPVVAMEGRQMRCRQAAAVLRSVGLGETVAATTAEYVDVAKKLGNDRGYRFGVAGRVREVMAGNPVCVDPEAYSRQCAEVFRTLATD